MQLHMAVKALAVLQGEITCNLREIIKKAELLHEKEEAGEEANHFRMLPPISPLYCLKNAASLEHNFSAGIAFAFKSAHTINL